MKKILLFVLFFYGLIGSTEWIDKPRYYDIIGNSSLADSLKQLWLFTNNHTYNMAGKIWGESGGDGSGYYTDTGWFNNSRSFIKLSDTLKFSGNFTLSFKCKLDSTVISPTFDMIFGLGANPNWVGFYNNTDLMFRNLNNQTVSLSTSGVTLTNYNVFTIVSKASDSLLLFVNGVFVNRGSNVVYTDSIKTDRLCGGYIEANNFNFRGTMCWMEYFNRELSRSEIDTLYKKPFQFIDSSQEFVVIAGWGQSNMAGRGDPSDSVTNIPGGAYKYENNNWVKLYDPNDDTKAIGNSIFPKLSEVLRDSFPNKSFGFMNYAKGGCGFIYNNGISNEYWANQYSVIYNNAINAIDSVGIIPNVLLLWGGESDYSMPDTSIFIDTVKHFMTRVRARFNSPALKFCFVIPDCPSQGGARTYIRGALRGIIASDANSFEIADAENFNNTGGCHYSTRQYDTVAIYLANKLKENNLYINSKTLTSGTTRRNYARRAYRTGVYFGD